MVDTEMTQKQPLAEVLSVQINECDMSGLIVSLRHSQSRRQTRFSKYLQPKKKKECKLIGMGKYFLRTTLARSIYASNGVLITIDLSYCTKSKGVDFSKGKIHWNFFDTKYYNVLSEKVYGGDGSVTVRYIVFSDAVEATVEVIVEKGGGNIHGCIYDRSNIGEPQSLFMKSFKDDTEHSIVVGLH
jgi:hypothetical protein